MVKEEIANELFKDAVDPWEERMKLWRELKDVFDDLTNFMDVGWNLANSLLRSQGWREVKRLHETVKQLPKLRELLEALGRMVEGRAGGKGQIVTVYEEVQRKVETRVEKLVPDVPEEICGITQGDDISRMLPSEAMLLATDVPVLQTLWHVKRLERSMLQYHMQGVDLDTVMTDQKQMEGKEEEKPAGMGPIIACLDTSGSMSGFPEQVAKALVLEGIKTASRESRKFYLINFSGPENTQALEMSAGPEGIQNLIGLLLGSFHGGTDVHAPLVEAIKQLRAEGGSGTEAREEHGVRFHGVLIGNYDSPAMTALCDEGCLHKFSSWNSLGGV
ncbi:unnamed protein product [Pedinophyceae sp. YPF-701]|nr:unnamed protein product [Pedinophyceae sp. YPF-701]